MLWSGQSFNSYTKQLFEMFVDQLFEYSVSGLQTQSFEMLALSLVINFEGFDRWMEALVFLFEHIILWNQFETLNVSKLTHYIDTATDNGHLEYCDRIASVICF